jgi:hypothetical protein
VPDRSTNHHTPVLRCEPQREPIARRPTSQATPHDQLPPRLLPILYIGVGHFALALAFGAVTVDPRGVSGFFYHSRMLAVVHLVTLGWITSSILGSLYILGPIALRMRLPATWRDYTAFGLRHPRARPPGLRRPDPAMLHAAASFVSLTVASIFGLWLAIAELSPSTLRVAMAYGVFGLVGFLGQLVVGMESRLLPLFAWYWAYANTGYKGPVRSVHEMAWRGSQDLVFVLWLFGVPALAGGLAFDAVPFVRAAGWSLLSATLLDTVNVCLILRHAFVRPKSSE